MSVKKYARLDKQIINVGIFIACIALGLGVLLATKQHAKTKLSALDATVLTAPRTISAFAFTDDQGKPFTQASIRGQWSMLFFGFTNCPQMCPTTMAELDKAYKTMQKEKLTSLPEIYMISIDPERDTQQKIHDYVRAFNPNFHGAYAKKQEVDKLAKQLGVAYMKAGQHMSHGNYTINHTGAIMLFNPEGKLVAFFNLPHQAKQIAHDFQAIEEYR